MPVESRQNASPTSWYTLRRYVIIIPAVFACLLLAWTQHKPRRIYKNYVDQSKERCSVADSYSSRKVAIIGAGSAGASTAYYLRGFQSPCLKIDITVYERSNYVGGRSITVSAFNEPTIPLEVGASIFVEVNRNLVSAAKKFGLNPKKAGADRPSEAANALGVWDGQGFRFVQDGSSYWWYDIAKLLWQYGLAPVRTQLLMKKTVNKFLQMYDDPVFPFESLTVAAESVDLAAVTSKTGETFLGENGIDPAFSQDIIQASTRVNYAQNLQQIHGLEAMVCMATDGAMSIEGGNYQIFAEMIASAEAALLLNTSVTTVAREGKHFRVRSAQFHAEGQVQGYEELFDAVVIAAPFQFSNLTVAPSSIQMPQEVSYVQLHVTLFTSPHRLSPSFFGLEPDESVPEVVLTTLPDKASAKEPPFLSISTLRKVSNPNTSQDEYAYKIFSMSPLNSTFISNLLGFQDPQVPLDRIPISEVSWVFQKIWNSYPYLPPRSKFSPLRLDEGLYYTSGMESFISTLETSSLMGMNVAGLIANAWNGDTILKGKQEHADM